MENQTVTVLGAGYVGLTTAVLLAHANYKVYLIEPNKERLDTIKSGKSFFYEYGLDPLLGAALESKNLIPASSYETAIPNSNVVFSCVGTPDNPDGSSNLTYVFAAAEETLKLAKPGTIYVQKSTVPVGTGKKIEQVFSEHEANIPYVSNPEFLREGTAIVDTLYFDRVVAGGNNKNAVSEILDIYVQLERNRDHIAHLADINDIEPQGDHYIATTLNSAELIKVTANAFLALKISFANSIAILADKADADVVEVMDAVGTDRRIGRAFLNAGRGYGGGCFPKDVSGLISSALEYGVDLDIMEAAQEQNRMMPGYIVDKLQDELGRPLQDKRVAVLGLSFKANTSDTRKSPGIAIANKLAQAEATVLAYDPEANDEAEDDLLRDITITPTLEEAIKGADAVIITTEWRDFLEYPADDFARLMSGKVLFDAMNQYSALDARAAGLHYVGVGHNV